MPENIKTDADLLRRLHEAAGKALTAEELRAQRVSFIAGNMPKESMVTREQIGEMLDEEAGEKVA